LGIHFYDSMVVFEKGDVWQRESILSIPIKTLENKNIYIWGAGNIGKTLTSCFLFENLNIRAIIDSNPNIHGTHYKGIPILSPNTLQKNNDIHIVICSKHHFSEIKEILESKGFEEFVDFTYYSDYVDL